MTERAVQTLAVPRWPFVAIVCLLALMVAVPLWEGARRGDLLSRTDRPVARARTALLEAERAFASAAADTRGYLITRDPRFLTGLGESLAQARDASLRLEAATTVLGRDVALRVRELKVRSADWVGIAAELAHGIDRSAEAASTLIQRQQRLEEVMEAAARVDAALDEVEETTRSRLRASEILEDVLVGVLGLAAVVVSLFLAWLMRRLENTSRELGESEARFRQIAESVREAIWVADPAYTTYYYINPAQERIWGRSMARALGDARSFLDVVHPDDRARVEAALEGYAAGARDLEYRVVRPDGEVRWVWARGYPVRDPRGRVFRIAGIAEDITEHKRVEEEREQSLERERRAHAELELAVQVRDQVLRIVSHDLRNPIHTLGMAVELLDMPLTEEERAKQLGVIRRTLQRANRLVLDLLDGARLQSGSEIPIVPAPMEVAPLLAQVEEAFRLQALNKLVRLEFVVGAETPPVLADHDRLLQVLANLVGNAIKFTPEGGSVRVAVAPDGLPSVQFSVCDTGPGIPAGLAAVLFEPFAQARDSATLGTGLGLSIAKGIVDAHGGQLSVASRPGEGTTFRFTLPAAPHERPTVSRPEDDRQPRGDRG